MGHRVGSLARRSSPIAGIYPAKGGMITADAALFPAYGDTSFVDWDVGASVQVSLHRDRSKTAAQRECSPSVGIDRTLDWFQSAREQFPFSGIGLATRRWIDKDPNIPFSGISCASGLRAGGAFCVYGT